MDSLFRPGNPPDPDYCALRDAKHCAGWKAHCEALWQRFKPYADDHFLEEIRRQFHPRFWEMYLAVAFLERGFTLHRHKDGGAEFGIDISGRRYWFDAIAPTQGIGADAVPQMEGGGWVPTQQIILRYTSAVTTKRDKWRSDLEKGRVSLSDGFIVAVNDRSIRWAFLGAEMPYIVKALYGIGDLAVAISTQTLQVVESKHQPRPAIAKASGVSVSSRAFVANECPEVSAVLYGYDNAANYTARPGDAFMVLHNHEPTVPLPLHSLQFSREYWVEGNLLQAKHWS